MKKRYLNIEEVDGKEIVRSKNAAGSLIYDTVKSRYIFVKQHRPAVGKEIIEICAGKIDEGETPVEAITREILEETGYKVDVITQTNQYHPTVGYSSELITLFYAEVSEQIEEGGGINTENITLIEATDLYYSGKIEEAESLDVIQLIDGKSVIAINHKLYEEDTEWWLQ